MRVVRYGLKWDTAKAQRVAGWSNDLSVDDPHHCTETLYRTSKGAYFLHGSGGPMSRWAQPAYDGGGGLVGGEGIGVCGVDSEEPVVWAEQRLTAEEYESTFGVVADG